MLAAIAFEPVVLGAAQVGRLPSTPTTVGSYIDPTLAALVREITAVEGEVLASPPLLLRLVEFCGFGIIAVGVAGLASGLAALVA
jgi:hypothetical protein